MKKEIQAASAWWKGQLAKKISVVSIVEAFQKHLEDILNSRYEGHWYVSDPLRGSAFRSISFDQRLDPLLLRTAKAVGIENLDILLSHVRYQVMFVNPGCVKVCNLAYSTPDIMIYEVESSQTPDVPMEVETKSKSEVKVKSGSKVNGTAKSKTSTQAKPKPKGAPITDPRAPKVPSESSKKTLEDPVLDSGSSKPSPPQRKPVPDPSGRFPSSVSSTASFTAHPTGAVWPSIPPAATTRRTGSSESRNIRHMSSQAIPFTSRNEMRPSGSSFPQELLVSNV